MFTDNSSPSMISDSMPRRDSRAISLCPRNVSTTMASPFRLFSSPLLPTNAPSAIKRSSVIPPQRTTPPIIVMSRQDSACRSWTGWEVEAALLPSDCLLPPSAPLSVSCEQFINNQSDLQPGYSSREWLTGGPAVDVNFFIRHFSSHLTSSLHYTSDTA